MTLEMLTQYFSFVEDAGFEMEVNEDEDGVTVKIRDTKFVDGSIVSRKS